MGLLTNFCIDHRTMTIAVALTLSLQNFGCKPKSGQTDTRVAEELYVATDFTAEGLFTSGIEGPAYVDGTIYAVNFNTEGTIGAVDQEGRCYLFVKLPEGSIGNGIRCNDLGDLFVADYTGHNVLKIDRTTRNIEVYAHSDAMNQPNDLAIRSDGMLFASDPNWKEGTGQLWRINTDGSVHLLEKDMGTTNGIEVSSNEKYLYVNESVQRTVWRYDLSDSGNISNKTLLHQFPDFGMDGMRCDNQGNLFITRHGKGTIAILNPAGELIREVILHGKKPSNITFGGKDGRTCYVTLQDRGAFEQFRSEHPGRSFHLRMRN
jgi:gluconolactonase